MKKPPDAHATIRLRFTREMGAGELVDLWDQLKAEVDRVNAEFVAAETKSVQRLAAYEHELAERFTAVAEREEAVAGKEAVLAGTREPMPEDLAARIRGVEVREQELNRRLQSEAQLVAWERHIGLYEQGLKAREGAVKHDEMVTEGRRLQLQTDERVFAARKRLSP